MEAPEGTAPRDTLWQEVSPAPAPAVAAAADPPHKPDPRVPAPAVAAAADPPHEPDLRVPAPAVAAAADPPHKPDPRVPQLTFTSNAEARWFAQPKIQQLVGRMADLGELARARATTQREKALLAKYYSNDGLKRRVKLLFEPEVVEALERIWAAADTDGSNSIEKSEYLVMHRKLVLALDPSTKPKAAFKAAEEDWRKDSEGRASLDKDRFFWCWFELAVRARAPAARSPGPAVRARGAPRAGSPRAGPVDRLARACRVRALPAKHDGMHHAPRS